ncbi:hypothetical protein [Virgibacillus oceani]|uniref:Uncharacterized protein n=1 Tax=Virgibacillus oceani TaxID=1479511 RepID=A0A917H1Z0_9BACI|nr:hypothetical protein [Virgibacillus oceani]GGG64848.1 hypothetical protein GCM10011398_05600 [Virgibacillus oceani]
MAVKNPEKCSECEATDIKLMGATTFAIANEGKSEPTHALVFKCNNCSNLTFKLPN